MAVAWSKTMPHTCYEMGHCWTSSCTDGTVPLYWSSFKYSLKIYGSLYLLTALLKRRKKEYYIKHVLPESLRSAFFLATNAAVFMGTFCLWRHLVGQTAFISSGFLPGFCASLSAIVLERKSRRGVLALYLLNLATETAFKMAVSRGMLKSVKHGEVLLFSIVMGFYTYLYKQNALQDVNMSRVMSFMVGSGEVPSGGRTGPGTVAVAIETETTDKPEPTETATSAHASYHAITSYLPKTWNALIDSWQQGPKHQLCQHKSSCLSNSVESGVRLFVIGYVMQAAMKLLRALTMIFQKPRALLEALKHRDNMYLGLFLGSFATLLRISNCLLRWIRNKDSPVHGILSGFVAGWSMMWYKSSSISMWLTSKLAEISYMKGIEAGVLPYFKHGDVIVYTLSTAFIIHAAVFEPHNIRPAYWKFLLNLTDQKLGLMNRRLFDAFGTNASTWNPSYWPDYDKSFIPNL